MNNIIFKLSEISIGFLFSLPYIYICLRMDYITKKMKYKSDFSGRLGLVAFISFILGSITINYGGISEWIFLIWGFMTIPLVIALLTLIDEITVDDNLEQYHRDNDEVSFIRKLFRGMFQKLNFLQKNKFFNKLNTTIIIGIPLSNLISLVVLTLAAFSLIVADINMNVPSVLDYHKYIINKIADSGDPKMVIIQETTSNGGMAKDLLEDIQKIKNGKAIIELPFPWGADVIVHSGNETWTFSYWRAADTWELEGLQGKSFSHY